MRKGNDEKKDNCQERGVDQGERQFGPLLSSKCLVASRKRNLLLVICRGRWHSLRHQLNSFVLYDGPKPRGRPHILHRDPLIGASIYVCAVRHLVTLEVKAEEKWVYTIVLTIWWDSIHLSWVWTERHTTMPNAGVICRKHIIVRLA